MQEVDERIVCHFFICGAQEVVAYFPIYFNRLEWVKYLHKLLHHGSTFAQSTSLW
jgi:hypothetical protein